VTSKAYLNSPSNPDLSIIIVPPILANGERLHPANTMMKLDRAAYGTKESGTLWFEDFNRRAMAASILQSRLNPCIFKKGSGRLGLYVNDM